MSDELTILTTEHYTLQSARGACLQDMQGRTTFFLTVVSGTLVALSFLSAAMHFGQAFAIVTAALLLFLWILGVLSFLRVAQISVEDTILSFGISRIRHRYVELMPSVAPLFVRSIHDDAAGLRAEIGASGHWWQALMPTQALLVFVVSVVGGCEIGVVLTFVLHRSFAGALIGGIVAFAINLVVLTRASAKSWMSAADRFPPRFPSATAQT